MLVFFPSAARKTCLWIPGPAAQCWPLASVCMILSNSSFYSSCQGRQEQYFWKGFQTFQKYSDRCLLNVLLCHVDLHCLLIKHLHQQLWRRYKVKLFFPCLSDCAILILSVYLHRHSLAAREILTVASKWRRWDGLCGSILLTSTHQTSLFPLKMLLCVHFLF